MTDLAELRASIEAAPYEDVVLDPASALALVAVAEAARDQVNRHPCDTIDTLHDALAAIEAALKETR